jgi:hypothetical protein
MKHGRAKNTKEWGQATTWPHFVEKWEVSS